MVTMPWQERVDGFVGHLLRTKPGSITSVRGRTGQGKTRLLRDVAADLPKRDVIPVFLSPPRGEEDTAGAALAAAADTLRAHTLLNGQTAALKDLHTPRAEKIDIVLRGLVKATNSAVLLLDEPARWPAGEWSDESSATSRQFTQQVCQALAARSGCRVVYTGWHFGVGTDDQPYQLPRAWNETDLPPGLVGHPAWQQVKAGLGGTFGERTTPLLCRMYTLLAALATPAEAVAAARGDLPEHEVAALVERHAADRPPLRRAWACLAAVRQAFDRRLYERLAGPLPDDLRGLMEELLLTRADGRYELHPVLAQAVNPRKVLGAEYRAVQKDVATYYLEQPASLAAATEAYFHATEAGDDDLAAAVGPFFVEQLHLRGRSLSRRKRHAAAAEVFRQAADLDPADDYARHYRAFNLDWIAEDRPTVEAEYQRAIGLNPRHPWWHSRWINYLVTVGRTADAHAAFGDATDALRDATAARPDRVYESLHCWVAALLLDRGQLDFARRVLDRVPAAVRQAHPGFAALDEKWAALAEARRGWGVFPLSVPASRHWQPSPHLDFPPQVDGQPLRSWNPARVEAVSADGVTLIVGRPPAGDTPPAYGRVHLPAERVAAAADEPLAALRPGRFVELGFYGDAGVLRIRAHPDAAWEDPALPDLVPPDTLRYLRKQEAAS